MDPDIKEAIRENYKYAISQHGRYRNHYEEIREKMEYHVKISQQIEKKPRNLNKKIHQFLNKNQRIKIWKII